MKKITIYFIFFTFLFNYLNFAKAENKISYIDIDYILKNSLAGKSITLQLEKKHKTSLDKFKLIEKNLIDRENKIIAKKNLLKKEEFDKIASQLNKDVQNYRKDKKFVLNKINEQKIKSTKKILDEINPILADYSKKNSISIILQKKNIVIGKKELDITQKIITLLDNKVKQIKIE